MNMKKGYVYSITNSKNGMVYYGSTSNLKRRLYSHKKSLDKNSHDNVFLQKDWNKYGENSFTFEIVEELEYEDIKEILNIEDSYISSNNTIYPNGYNLKGNNGGYSNYLKRLISTGVSGENNGMFGNPSYGMLGKNHSEETKSLLSKILMGNTRPLGTKPNRKTISKFVGVTYIKESDKWQSRISYQGTRIHLGYFKTDELAAKAYDKKAVELFGTDAKLNFPLDKGG